MNHNLQLLQNLYSSVSGKYLKFKVRLDKAIHSGRFYKLNKRKQSTLVSRLKKLYERLKSLQTQLRLAGAGSALALALSVSNPSQAQSSLGPYERNDAANPLPPPYSINHPRLAVVDIDNDGDLDVFAGTGTGDIEFFRNTAGPTIVKRFTKVSGPSNPFDGINKGPHAAPAFIDVDGDLDFDMLLGTGYGDTFFFRNTGSRTNPVFTEQTGISNPFNGITGTSNKYGTEEAIPVFVDIDGDLDQDLFIGSSYSSDIYGSYDAVQFYENAAGNFAPSFHNLTGYLRYFSNSAFTFADLDLNGDLDVIVSNRYGSTRCFLEDGGEFNEQIGPWNSVDRIGNPMNYFSFDYGSPVFADFDGDGDLDLLIGQADSYSISVQFFLNTDGAYTFESQNDLNISPLGGVDVGREAAPTFVDLDNDGDLDAVLGAKYNSGPNNPETFVYIRQSNGEFIADPTNPIRNTTSQDVTPVFVDIDGDTDPDLFYCYGSTIKYLKNNNGVFETQPTLFPTLNPSNAQELSLSFVDVDNDGDFDALLGNDRYGQPPILFFRNNGSATAPTFALETPPAPFNSFAPGSLWYPNLSAVDLDNDGDIDIVMSETYYLQSGYNGDRTRVLFFENNGDGTFTEQTTPIIEDGSPKNGFTSFADFDGDGDLDALMGNGYTNENGRITYFENTNPPPVTNVNNSVLVVVGGEPTVLDPNLTINDPDDDDISSATVTISDFVAGEEELGFTAEEGIDGSFDDETGVLTFIGRASADTYEELLRTVTINFTGNVPGGRRSNPNHALDLAQDVTFQVRDVDFTLATVSVVSINIVPGGAELDIYNAMSPNSDDNLNSYFKIEQIETVSPENKVTIYNRWGDVVFEVSQYNNSIEGKRFNGVSDKGKDLPSGTYFYRIELATQTITGYLSLKR